LSDGSTLRINEWMAKGEADEEFIELYNPDPLPVDLSRWVLTDDPTIRGVTNRYLPIPSFIAGTGSPDSESRAARLKPRDRHWPID